jgi:transcriptional regulator with XRE-family HTH domain
MDLSSITDDEICAFLASQIRAERLRRGYSQATMANTSGIALRTYKRIELRGTGSIRNLIIIMRTLERITAVKLLFPQSIPNARLTIFERVQQIAEDARRK